jgi:hypothetical protein
MLMVMSMLGISAIQNSILEVRMASNTTNWHRAFQASEIALTSTVRDFFKEGSEIQEISWTDGWVEISPMEIAYGNEKTAARLIVRASKPVNLGYATRHVYQIRSEGYSSTLDDQQAIKVSVIETIIIHGPPMNGMYTG